MYNEYFGFRENPFSIAPDPRYLYLSEMHQDGLAHLKYGLSSEGCIILLTGEAGTGKTTLCRFFLEQLEPTANLALIINPGLSAFELLATVCDEFMVKVSDDAFNTKQYLDALNEFLLEAHADNNPALLVIDEAQNLDKDALEMIRLLTNLETNRQKLLKIFLLGQSELSTLLLSPDLTQVNQRITGRFHLTGLQANETGQYITHRLKVAGGDAGRLFGSRAVKRIHQLTGGVPRLINSLCDRSLIGAYADSQERVDEAIVKKAAREILGFDHASKTIEVPVNSLLAGVLTMLAIVLIWVGTTSDFFHLNLSSVLPPPQKIATAPPEKSKQDLTEQEAILEDGDSSAGVAKQAAEARPDGAESFDEQSTAATDDQAEASAEADGSAQLVVEASEAPSLNSIFIAPVEIAERRDQEPATRILINTIEINE
jgi:general secretion pathway protein A